MNHNRKVLAEETAYLAKTLSYIRSELENGSHQLSAKKKKLISQKKDMWENTVYSSKDISRVTEISQYLMEINIQSESYVNTLKRLENFKKMIDTPYFGRFDFIEDECRNPDKLYIGLHNVIDSKTHEVYVYDWRAPVSSLFYRYEPGRASYDPPAGVISGEILLKRQYNIKNSKLRYFFDCSLTINDEILQEILSRNSSVKMKNIVETIQKEQDIIIRDTENELLIVQGVAGSGKTSVALHRVAFLLYNGLNSNIKSNNVIIISPNAVFSRYISNVLPELGEENIQQTTFDDIVELSFGDRFDLEKRSMQLESLINGQNCLNGNYFRKSEIRFKGSGEFIRILDRLIEHYQHRMIEFDDVYYDGIIVETKQQLKNRFLNDKTGLPIAKRLKRIENMLLDKIHRLPKTRLKKLEDIVARSEGHDLEIKSFSRLLSMKRSKLFLARLHKFTRVDFWHIYKTLFSRQELLYKLAQGLNLPAEIEQIIYSTRKNLEQNRLFYEDCAPLLYLMLKIEGSSLFPEIKQVVIDEAQDYYHSHYAVFKILFGEANYTMLGDVQQSLERETGRSIYEGITKILNKPKTIKMYLNKGYRCSCEINAFSRNILGTSENCESFERHEQAPVVTCKESYDSIDESVAGDIRSFSAQEYGTIAVICKNQLEANRVYQRLKGKSKLNLVGNRDGITEKGVSVIPSYLAKGLEFDAVIIYCASKENYNTPLDRKLLYVACTRALHRLVVYYKGEISPFLTNHL